MRSLVFLLALGLCAVGVVAAPGAAATCDGSDPRCVIDFLTMNEDCMSSPLGWEDICWAP